ncbi:hypothetical protein FKP32DRAFT_1680160 [Trametes sanguinea]|nr:hypothetical protein FKP32DRAFT_1680160 [Trametes sanguinea]
MHLFRSVFIFTAAILTFMATQASAFGILPLTRYMLDKVPDGAEDPTADTTAIAGDASQPDGTDTNSSLDSSIPVVADTSPVSDQPEPDETPAAFVDAPVASSSLTEAEPSQAADATLESSSSVAIPAEPTFVPVYAKVNSAERIVGLGHSVLMGSVAGIVFLIL